MTVFVLAVLAVVLGAAPVLARGWLRDIHPALAAKAIAVSLVGALVATELVAVSLGAPVLLRAVGAHGLAARCARMASHAVIGAPWIGWVSTVGALMLPMAVSFGYRRARLVQHAMSEVALLGRSTTLTGHRVIVVTSPNPVALCVAAYGGAVVVSDTLIEQLSGAELDAVVRHEQAHLKHSHHLLLRLAAAAECGLRAFPWARVATDQLRCSLERWADEEASGTELEARHTTRRALVGVALAGLPVDVAAFGGLATVVERLAALDHPAPARTPRSTVMAFGWLSALWAGMLFSVAVVVANFWVVLAMPNFCLS